MHVSVYELQIYCFFQAEEATTVKSLQSVNVTPPITPKRKKEEEEEETKRKRRKQDNGEEELDRTPGGMVKDLPAPPAPRSAKKKLVMSSEAEGTQEVRLYVGVIFKGWSFVTI